MSTYSQSLSCLRVLSRHSGLQARLMDAVRNAVGVRKIGHRQSDTFKKVVAGRVALAERLESVLNELIVSGADEQDIWLVLGVIEADVRAKLAQRRGEKVPGFTEAHCAEFAAEGAANEAQGRALGEKTPSALRAALDGLCRHAHAIRTAITATSAELQRVESQRQWGAR